MTPVDPFSEFLASLRIIDLGATGLVTLIVVMILMGKLVPKSVADAWKNAYFESQKANALKDEAIAQFAEAGLVSARALDALPQPRGGGLDDVVGETTETRRRRRQG